MSDTPHVPPAPARSGASRFPDFLANRLEQLRRRVLVVRTTREKVHGALLLLITVGLVVHHCALFWWYVEDTAISFAYARHLVQGEGLVPFPGGERIEGYSNPTWVALMALIQLVGVDPFDAARWVQLAMAVATIPIVYKTVRDVTGRDSDVPLLATAFLAANSQFAIYGGAGLENGLLNFLIAVGFAMTMAEIRQPVAKMPWSALVWLLVALTRPEGIMYSAVAGFCTMVFHLHARRSLVPTLKWLVLFFAPWGAYQAVRWWYFAWPAPNTYYAKLEDREPTRFVWDRKGWNWTRNFFHQTGQGYFLPVWLLGVIGDGRWRFVVALALFVLLGVSIELSHDQRVLLPVVVGAIWAGFWLGLKATEDRPPRWLVGASTAIAVGLIAAAELLRYEWHMTPTALPNPDWVRKLPSYEIASLVVLLPLIGYGARGWQLRLMSFLFCAAVMFFAVYVQWDWMKGFRWYATAAVPASFLFAFGVDGFVRFVEEMFGTAEAEPARWRAWSPLGAGVAVLLVAAQLPANIAMTVSVAKSPDASPSGVKQRVDYVDSLRDRLHVMEPWVDLDVDQGAHLWWSDFVMMDIAGLVDVPLAHNKFEKAFVREYVFEERRPHYAHVHDNWARTSGIPTHPEWRRDYVEVPGYGRGKPHMGNHVRRDLITSEAWPHGDALEAVLEGELTVYGPWIPSEPATGHHVYVELGLQATRAQKTPDTDDVRLLLFAADDDGVRAVWDLPPGYDWLPPAKWLPDEVFVGRFELPLPEAMAPGTYDLGVVVLGPDGAPRAPLTGEEASLGPGVTVPGEGVPPRYSAAEVVFPGALEVLTVDARAQAAVDDRDAAYAAAAALRCEEAEQDWQRAIHHRAGEGDQSGWRRNHGARVSAALAACWAQASDEAEDRDEQVRRLVRAHRWDHWEPGYRERADALSAELYDEGVAALEAEDWEAAYRLLSDAVAVKPTHAWARRYAEQARAFRLGTDPASKAAAAAEAAARAAERQERVEAARAKAKGGVPPSKAPQLKDKGRPPALADPEGVEEEPEGAEGGDE
jgi:hypothetical protein